jgi:hypothetical protein
LLTFLSKNKLILDVTAVAYRLVIPTAPQTEVLKKLPHMQGDFGIWDFFMLELDRLCGLVVRVPGCKPRDPGFVSQRYQIFCVAMSLERVPISHMRINEEFPPKKK